jgi:hypothetical protein
MHVSMADVQQQLHPALLVLLLHHHHAHWCVQGVKKPPKPMEVTQAERDFRRKSWMWLIGAGAVTLGYILLSGRYIEVRKRGGLHTHLTPCTQLGLHALSSGCMVACMRQHLFVCHSQTGCCHILSHSCLMQYSQIALSH